MNELFGIGLLPDGRTFAKLSARLALDLLVTTIVVRAVYYRLYQHRDYVFTYLLLNLVTFSLALFLSSVPIELGFALGLFGVFGILRYRTEAIQVRDLTYLFVVIGIALLNALASASISLIELLMANGAIAGAVCLLEWASFSGREQSQRVLYDRLDLLSPARSRDLLQDLRERTHLPVDRYEIGDVDLLRDTADLTIHWRCK
jgi:hypothetical protein